MESKVNAIDLGTMKKFKRLNPNLEIMEPRWAAGGVTAELRKMKVGELVLFPLDTYRYNTVRNIPYTGLAEEIVNGWSFSVKLDRPNKSAAVIRTA